MFDEMTPVSRLNKSEYGLMYDWACPRCRIECAGCGVYALDYGGAVCIATLSENKINAEPDKVFSPHHSEGYIWAAAISPEHQTSILTNLVRSNFTYHSHRLLGPRRL